MSQCDIGLIGLAVMGQNLVLNMERSGFSVAVYNRSSEKTKAFTEGPAANKRITAAYDFRELASLLKQPRRVMLMVKAGAPVDGVIEQLKPYLEPGDVIADGGNSFFEDTERRSAELSQAGYPFLGVGVSGGEEGALLGPSIMPGGPKEAYSQLQPVFTGIAAVVDGDPCVTYLGPRGSGHYVKMVHNGIEYGDMQLIAEAYHILRDGLGLSISQLHDTFTRWNQGELSSYLIEITADIFTRRDEETQRPLVDLILDEAEHKGTGVWTSHNALGLGVPIPTIDAAVTARIISSQKADRERASTVLYGPREPISTDRESFIDSVREALYASKICAYAQGMALLRRAGQAYEYHLDLGEVSRIWRGGCIIRAQFLNDLRAAYMEDPALPNLLVFPFFRDSLLETQASWRKVIRAATRSGIPTPAMSSSLAYYDAYRSGFLPANLIQAQRDYFGAHTYRRLDKEGVFHTEWKTS